MLFDNVARNWANKDRPIFNSSVLKDYYKDQPWVMPRMGGLGRAVEGFGAGLLGGTLGAEFGRGIAGEPGAFVGGAAGVVAGMIGPSRLMGAVNWRNLAMRAGIGSVKGAAAATKFAATGTAAGSGMLSNFLNWEVGRKVVPDTSLAGVVEQRLGPAWRDGTLPKFTTKTKVIPGW